MQAVTVASERRICKAAPGFPQVSYLAQTRQFITFILYSPECVDGAANADSQLSILRLLQRPHPATDLQALALIVTAEPYYAVRQPSNVVVLENVIRADQGSQ
jgi:hypothetical protein